LNEDYQALAKTLLKSPDDPRALTNMAALVGNRDLVKTQLALMQRAYAVKPDQYEVQINLGSAYTRAGEYGKALEVFRKASKHNTREAWHHVGMAYHDLGLFDKAVSAYDKSLAIAHDDYCALDRSLSLIAGENLIEGFRSFESRWALIPKRPIWDSNIPLWQGEDLTGKTLIVHHEQGWGDTLQVCRFLPRLKAMCAKLVFVSGPNLHRLVTENFGIECFDNELFPSADYHVPMMSVPHRLRIDWPDVYGKPYIKAAPRMLPSRGALNIGLVWGGSAKWVADSARSIDLLELTDLFAIPGIGWVSLQQDGTDQIQQSGLMGFIADAAPMLTDWHETARIVAGLDAVVTVDTSTAHLSAALGVPTYCMIPKSCCWRWPRIGRRTPWYDAMRLMRQDVPFDWKPVVQTIKDELIAMKTERAKRAA
jgi:hypothetical protein